MHTLEAKQRSSDHPKQTHIQPLKRLDATLSLPLFFFFFFYAFCVPQRGSRRGSAPSADSPSNLYMDRNFPAVRCPLNSDPPPGFLRRKSKETAEEELAWLLSLSLFLSVPPLSGFGGDPAAKLQSHNPQPLNLGQDPNVVGVSGDIMFQLWACVYSGTEC